MNDLRTLLEAADPVRDEPSLPAMDARAIRRRLLAAAETPPLVSFPSALPVAALIALTIVGGMAAGRRITDRTPPRGVAEAAVSTPGQGERRQVQFATPGGTRIIWTIDPNFQLRGVMP